MNEVRVDVVCLLTKISMSPQQRNATRRCLD